MNSRPTTYPILGHKHSNGNSRIRTCAYELIIHRINPFATIPENAEITRLISYLLQPYDLVAYPLKFLSVIAMHG